MDSDVFSGLIHVDFYRISEDNKTLKNEKYELFTIDGKSTGFFTTQNADGRQYLDYYVYRHPEMAGDLLPVFIKEKLASDNINDIIEWLDEEEQTYTTSGSSISFRIEIPVLLKQVMAEPGYKKNDLIFNNRVSVEYSFDANGTITRKNISINSYAHVYQDGLRLFSNYDSYNAKYTKFTYPVNSLKELNSLNEYYENENFACINTNNGMIISDPNECSGSGNIGSATYYLVPFFQAEKGTVKFEIENTVNGLAKYNASKEKKLEYKIKFKNVGDMSSTNNIITTYIPKELTVDVKSISDNGVYDKKSNSITWNIDLIDEGEVLNVSYHAVAPDDAKGVELIGHSTIKSDQVTKAVVSNNTIVTMDKIVEIIDNPETGMMIYIANTNIGLSLTHFIMIMVVLAVIVIFIAKKMLKIKRHS